MTRILHFSDIHIQHPRCSSPFSDVFSKRFVGAMNLELRRRQRFAENETKLNALSVFAQQEAIDLVIGTGDYTALGDLSELQSAKELIKPLTQAPLGFITLPGNHDVYTRQSAKEKRFEQCFGEFLVSDLPHYTVQEESFPVVRLIGEHLAVVVINSAIAHWQIWRSDGFVSEAQLDSLQNILNDPLVESRFVIFAIHYGLYRADGTPDHFRHGLRNAEELIRIFRKAPYAMVIHGHIHHRFFLPKAHCGIPIFCAGSTTHAGREGLWVYDISGMTCRAWPGTWTASGYRLEDTPIEVVL